MAIVPLSTLTSRVVNAQTIATDYPRTPHTSLATSWHSVLQLEASPGPLSSKILSTGSMASVEHVPPRNPLR
jgi:hypothetical protein